jgi:metal-dependent amidase/aminoacylase/carboxypeptidase family protein
MMVAEDFSFFALERPGAMLLLGMGGDNPLHSDKLCVTPETLFTGERILKRIIDAG